MMNYFLHPNLTVTEVSPDKVHLANLAHQITIEGQNQNLKRVLQAIQTGTLAELLQQQDPDLETFYAILEFLTEHQFASLQSFVVTDKMMLDLALLQVTGQDGELKGPLAGYENVRPNSVAIFGQGELFSRVVAELRALDFSVLENPEESACERLLLITCSDNLNFTLNKKINALAIARQLPALFAVLNEHIALVGPLVIPGESSCFSCYEHRLAPNMHFVEETIASQFQHGNLIKPRSKPGVYAIAASFQIISQILKFFNRAYEFCLVNEVLEINLLDYATDIRPVLRIPHCPACYSQHRLKPKAAVRALL
ncbi:MAG: TOMM precursor leader peptide-binding protein [Gammaproteobacteria bacterium]|nr:TOMM precursor leader peptide-binding protein [Gammaproteobacteria bacterium]MBU1555374.1 TOMM precursor leader peptide-binding protein [Gammaproteobacteria bacterium]MBU2070538.1 TOMM precursor leader peptide-binding protein [Gammaproteobacteria bacterium]MBU2185350.1 TOMM precursor leader peptide-binding protein [Gammaproteobacteria bacterium]MBU2207044.1 TOMM precursor leader peptide-binding protein [Gammaproteobacteria bacterium]